MAHPIIAELQQLATLSAVLTEMQNENLSEEQAEHVHHCEGLMADYNVLWYPEETERTCPRCEEEETISAEQKVCLHRLKTMLSHQARLMLTLPLQAQKYTSPAELRKHMEVSCASPVSKWLREHRCNDDYEFECPYCKAAGISGMPTYNHLVHLVRHIHSSNARVMGKTHDELKAADGWYEGGFVKSFLRLIDDWRADLLLGEAPR